MIDTPAMLFANYAIADPYPLVTDDAELWLDLLSKAHNKNRYLFGILTWVRCVGARLEATGNPAMPYKIVPIIATRDCAEGWAMLAQQIHEELKKAMPEIFDRNFMNCANCKEKSCKFKK